MSEPETAYALARILGRDRQTIVRCVDRLQPDDFNQNGRPRWRVERVAEALALSPRERREAGRAQDRYAIHCTALSGLRVAFDEQLAAMEAETSPDKRRALALALAPLLAEYQRIYLDIGRQLHVADDDVLGHRADLILEEMIGEVGDAAGRDGDSNFFGEMVAAMAVEAG